MIGAKVWLPRLERICFTQNSPTTGRLRRLRCNAAWYGLESWQVAEKRLFARHTILRMGNDNFENKWLATFAVGALL
ncbi:MAG: hypothetical protein ACRD06_06695, partial [Terriglobia bacterium]